MSRQCFQPLHHNTGAAGHRNGRQANMGIVKRIQIQTPASAPQGNKLMPMGWFDNLSFEAWEGRKIAIVRKGGYRIATNDKNPIYKAAIALQKFMSGKAGVRIEVQKNSPPEKGLRSQMGNAAGTLLALNQLWSLGFSAKKLISIGARIDPILAKILRLHFKKPKKIGIDGWIAVAIPKTIRLDREWLAKEAIGNHSNPESVAIARFPDLKIIMDTLDTIGWSKIQMAGNGPAIVGYSKRKIDISMVPESLRRKLDFIWVGKACNGEFKLLH